MIVQLYTMQSAEEALACVAAGADHVGLTPPQGLPGELPSLWAMRDIVRAVGDTARCVALTVDMDPTEVITMVEVVQPAILHLCPLASETSPRQVAALRGAADGVAAAARALADGRRTVVARLGAEGAFACPPSGEAVAVGGFPAGLRNPVGAGDAFNGGFVAARVAGLSLAEALRWGNVVGALKLARDGGARDQPSRPEVEALLAGPGGS